MKGIGAFQGRIASRTACHQKETRVRNLDFSTFYATYYVVFQHLVFKELKNREKEFSLTYFCQTRSWYSCFFVLIINLRKQFNCILIYLYIKDVPLKCSSLKVKIPYTSIS